MARAILVCLCLTCGLPVSSSLGELINDEFSSLLQSHRTLERGDIDVQVNFGKDGLNWGLTLDHLNKYADWCDQHKVVLIFRQSEKDTLIRIHQTTFKTKSVDVKDKSSNWGLTRGFVPLDMHFSKKAKDLVKTSTPIHDIWNERHADIKKAEEKDDDLQKGTQRTGISAIALVLTQEQVKEATGEDGTDQKSIPMEYYSGHFWYLAESAKGSFEVKWQKCKGSDCTVPEPVYVWAYGARDEDGKKTKDGAPVTGDYDLWMVAPSVMSPLLGVVEGVSMPLFAQGFLSKHPEIWAANVAVDAFALDKHVVPGGVSTMPKFLNQLMQSSKLNTILDHPWDKKGFKVINHGAEMQNFYFAQAIDDHLTIILPTELSDVARFLGLKSASSSMTDKALHLLGERHHNIWMGVTRSAIFANFIISARHLGYLAPLNAEYYKLAKDTDSNFVHLACLMGAARPDFLENQAQFYRVLETTLTPKYTACIEAVDSDEKTCQDKMRSDLSQLSSFSDVYVIAHSTKDMKSAWQIRIKTFAGSANAEELLITSKHSEEKCRNHRIGHIIRHKGNTKQLQKSVFRNKHMFSKQSIQHGDDNPTTEEDDDDDIDDDVELVD